MSLLEELPVRRRSWAASAAVAVVFVAALFIHIGRPFLRHRESVCTAYGILARNHVRLGLKQTRLASYEVVGSDLGLYGNWREYCYPNRPFLSVLYTALWFQLFGDTEAVLRLSLIVAALGSMFAFTKLIERLLDPKWAAPALALFALNPMFWYFSIVAVHLTIALTFSLAAWACWVRWEENRRYPILTILFLALACETDWPGYFAALSIAVDAAMQKRWLRAGGPFSVGLAALGLHLLHLTWVNPEGGTLVRRFLRAGAERSAEGFPGPIAFLVGELRELGLYFTVGLLGLALVGFRRLPRRAWPLALIGLDEIVFMRWAHVHDYLTYSLVPFFAVAAAVGLQSLWSVPSRRPLAIALLVIAAAQSAWITGNRLTREGAAEVNYRAALAIRETVKPQDRVLITIADQRQFTPYYADRYTGGVEPWEPNLMIHPSGGRQPAPDVESLEKYFSEFDVVLVGDPQRAASEIQFFRGSPPSPDFRFLETSHPLRRKLEETAIAKQTHGAFVLYRLR